MARRAWSPGYSVAGLAVAIALASCPAFADPPSRDAEALLNEGIAAYQAGKYAEAAVELEKAYDINHAPRMLFNIARAYDKGGDTAAAVRYYDRYLQSESTEPDLAAKAREALERIRANAATPTIKSPPPEAKPAPSPQPAAAAPPAQARDTSQAAPAPSNTVAWVFMGTGTAALVAGGGLALWASRTASQEKSSTDPVQKPSLRDQAYGRALAADITMGAGLVLLTTGFILRVTSHAPSAPSPSALRVGPAAYGRGVSAEWTIDL
jgi:iron complex outermembrane receptor protein